MGLDSVEFALAIEDAFEINLPEEDVVGLVTPRLLIDYLQKKLPVASAECCLDQVSFYALRSAGVKVLGKPEKAFRPDTPWAELIPEKSRRKDWKALGAAVGATKWPRIKMFGAFPGDSRTVGDTARFISTKCPIRVVKRGQVWTRKQITEVVTRLLASEFLITEAFNLDDRFVQDLGLE